MYQSVNQSVKI